MPTPFRLPHQFELVVVSLLSSALAVSVPSTGRIRAQVTPAPSDTSGLAGTGTFGERLTKFVEALEAQELRGELRGDDTAMARLAGALRRTAVYLESHQDEATVLILGARLGRLQQTSEPIISSREDPLSVDRILSPYAPYHAYLDRALTAASNEASAYYWKARLYGMSFNARTLVYGFDEPPDTAAALLRAQGDSAALFARRAVELAPQELSYREALALFLVHSDHLDEAMAVVQDASGGRHPIYLLLTDWQMLPVPPAAVAWPRERRQLTWKQQQRGTDYADLRVRAYALSGPASQVEAFYKAQWPGLRLFEVENEKVEGTRIRLLVQFLQMNGTKLQPTGTKRELEKMGGEPPDGFLLMVGEVTKPPAAMRNQLPVEIGEVVTILSVIDTRGVRPK